MDVSMAASIMAVKQAQTMQRAAYAAAKISLGAQDAQGAQALELMASAAQAAQSAIEGSVDLYA